MPNKNQRDVALRFTRALSGVAAKRMKRLGLGCVYDVCQKVLAEADIPPTSVYSALNGRSRTHVWTMHHIAKALDMTLDDMIGEADKLVRSGKPFQTVPEAFGDARKQGRPRKRNR